jgi:hypothetical protein
MQQGCNVFSVNEGTNNNYANTLSYTGTAMEPSPPPDVDKPTFSIGSTKPPPEEVWNETDFQFSMDRNDLIKNKETTDKIPRPLNSYLLYSKHANKTLKYKNMNIEAKYKSKLIAEDWEKEPKEVKYIFECGAEVAKIEHAKKHVGYTYKKGNKKKYDEESESAASFSALNTSFPTCLQESESAASPSALTTSLPTRLQESESAAVSFSALNTSFPTCLQESELAASPSALTTSFPTRLQESESAAVSFSALNTSFPTCIQESESAASPSALTTSFPTRLQESESAAVSFSALNTSFPTRLQESESAASLALTTSFPTCLQHTNNNNPQILTLTMEESYQSDDNISFDHDIIFSPATPSQVLDNSYQFESNSPITEEMQFDDDNIFNSYSPQSSNSFLPPTTSSFTMPVENFSSPISEFVENQQTVHNIIGFNPSGYYNNDQSEPSIPSNPFQTLQYHHMPVGSNLVPAYDFIEYSNSLTEPSVPPTTATFNINNPYIQPESNEHNRSTGLNNLSGLVIDDENQMMELPCNQIMGLPSNQIMELMELIELTCNQINLQSINGINL